MFINLHIYKVTCTYNGSLREFLVVGHDLISAEKEALDFWRNRDDGFQGGGRSFRVESVSLLGAVIDCTGQTIAAQPA